MQFDLVAILDWSAAGSPKKGRDSIWLGLTDQSGTQTENIPTRLEAESRLSQLIEDCQASGKRLLLGVDFSLSAPKGLTETLTGTAQPFALWSYLRDRLIEGPDNFTNYRDVAAEMNGAFAEEGPFWGNTTRHDIIGLPRKKPPLPKGLAPYRRTEVIARHEGAMPKQIWQLAGAGAVGAQSLTGIAMLARIKAVHPMLHIWPFEAPAQITVAEVYPSLISAEVRAASTPESIPDEVQVRLLSQAFFRLSQDDKLSPLFQNAPPDGAILASGEGNLLRGALPRLKPLPSPKPEAVVRFDDLSSIRADLGLPAPNTTKTALAELAGRVLAAPLASDPETFPVGKRLAAKHLPALFATGLSTVRTFAEPRISLIGSGLDQNEALVLAILRSQAARSIRQTTLPTPSSRIKARLTALAADSDVLICLDDGKAAARSALETETTIHTLRIQDHHLPAVTYAIWRGKLVLFVPTSSETLVYLAALVIVPLLRCLEGESYSLPHQHHTSQGAPIEGLTLGVIDGKHFVRLDDLPLEQALVSATHIARPISDQSSAEVITYALSDLGID